MSCDGSVRQWSTKDRSCNGHGQSYHIGLSWVRCVERVLEECLSNIYLETNRSGTWKYYVKEASLYLGLHFSPINMACLPSWLTVLAQKTRNRSIYLFYWRTFGIKCLFWSRLGTPIAHIGCLYWDRVHIVTIACYTCSSVSAVVCSWY